MADLAGKVVLISGSSSGIGAAAAVLFAKHGSSLSITGRNEDRLKKVKDECVAAGLAANKIALTIGDITDEAVQAQLVANTLKLGPLNVLINNAGAGGADTVSGSALCSINESMEVYDRIMNVNTRSVVSLTKMCLPHLEKTKGVVINVSSVGGIKAVPPFTYYCMAKAAINHFTRCLAADVGSKGIRVNCINPGAIETGFASNLGLPAEVSKGLMEKAAKAHALGRVGRSDEVAKLMLYLASDDSSFTTGQCHVVDGGLLVNYRMD